MTRVWRRRGFLVGVALSLVVLVVWGRTIYEAHAELALAGRYADEGQSMRAVEHYRRAIRWAAPLNPYPSRASRSLRELALDLEREDRPQDALLAWRSILGSEKATRTPFSGLGARSGEAVEHIRALSEQADVEAMPASVGRGSVPGALLPDETALRSIWALALVVGFFTWVGALAFATIRGFDAAGAIRWPDVRSPLVAAAAGFALFVVGMLFA